VVVWVRYQGQRQSISGRPVTNHRSPSSNPGGRLRATRSTFRSVAAMSAGKPDHLEQAVGPPGIKGHLWVLFSCETAVPISRRPG
jgi:hypothetical protein